MTMTNEQQLWAISHDITRAYERRGQVVPAHLARREAELSDAALFSTLPPAVDRRAQAADLNPYTLESALAGVAFVLLMLLMLWIGGA